MRSAWAVTSHCFTLLAAIQTVNGSVENNFKFQEPVSDGEITFPLKINDDYTKSRETVMEDPSIYLTLQQD